VLDIDFGWRAAWCLLAGLLGTALQLRQPSLWPDARYLTCLLMGLAASLPLLRWRLAWPLAVVGLAAVAFGATGLRASNRLADGLSPALEGETLVVTGVVASLPQSAADGTRFAFEVETAAHEGQPVRIPAQLYLGWYREVHGEDELDAPRLGLQAGERWRFPVRLKRPHGAMNPGGGDYELWLFEQGVRATGYVRSRPEAPAQLLAEGVAHPLERWRQQVRDAIRTQVPDARAAGMLAALAVGDQAAIERDDWDIFRASGIAHLVSISGLHVTMMAWLVGLGIGWVWRRVPGLALRFPAPQAARCGGLLGGIGYALLAGWGVPAQRTVLMLAIATLTTASGVRWPWPLVLLLAAAGVVWADPWALLQVGFWLSFAAVALLMASSPAQDVPEARAPAAEGWGRRAASALRAHLSGTARTQALTTLGLAPLTLVFFQQLSLVSFFANLVAIPLVTLVITPLSLLGVLLPPLWSLGAVFIDALVAGLAWLVSWPAAVWTLPPAPAWAAAAGLAAGLLLMMPWPLRVRLLALPLALPLLWPVAQRPPAGQFELVAADVGQGTSVLVRTAHHLLVYDTGPAYGTDNDAGQRVLLPLLRARAEDPVDLLMLSHSDLDHTGGAASLITHWPVRLMSSSLSAGHPLLQRGVPHRPCSAGQQWVWDGVRFSVLSPHAEALQPPPPGSKPTKPNWLSCVLRVEDAAGHAALLMGDAEVPQEARMLADGAPLRAEIVIVPHHGSRTSSSTAFIDAVHPRIAMVQAAYRSRFGHPAPDIVQRYETRGVQVLRSDRCGAWTWSTDGAHCERDFVRRYWQFAQ
jgi:competence protein ComEC